jgi:hypothetical protein
MGMLQRLTDAISGPATVPRANNLPAVRSEIAFIEEAPARPSRPTQQLEIPEMLSARGTEQCFRCGQRAQSQQLIYAYRGMHFGGDCIGRALIIEREKPGIGTTQLQDELVRDMKRFRALGMARAAQRMMKENS